MNGVILDLERLERLRKKAGLTKMEMAKRIEVAQPTYLRYESGERKPNIHVVRAMARVLGTSDSYLLGKAKKVKADYLTINSKDDAMLFKLIAACQKLDAEQLERLAAFVEQL